MDGELRSSVAFPRRWWYPACRSQELGSRPLAEAGGNGDGQAEPVERTVTFEV